MLERQPKYLLNLANIREIHAKERASKALDESKFLLLMVEAA